MAQNWDALSPDLQARFGRFRTAMIALSQAYAGQIEGTMKREFRWTPRTGNAGNRLFGRAFHIPLGPPPAGPDEYGVIAGHGMEYGIWLELGTSRWEGGPDIASRTRVESTGKMGYPIVHPTLQRYSSQYFAAAHDLLARAMRGQA